MRKIRKKYLLIILSIMLIISNFSLSFAYWASNVQGASQQGSGTVVIGSWVPTGYVGITQTGAGDYITLNEVTATGKYILMENISNISLSPLGGTSEFTGEFYGNGFSISNITIIGSSGNMGLFSINNGIISGVTLNNITISNSSSSDKTVGGLAGINKQLIEKSYVTGSITVTTAKTSSGWFSGGTATIYAGGLVGLNEGSIKYSHAAVNVTASASQTGGFLGTANAYAYAGGLVGYSTSTNAIEESYANGNISASASRSGATFGTTTPYAGGLVGRSTGTGGIMNSFATGNVTVNTGSNVGGLVGDSDATVANSYRRDGQLINGTLNGGNTIGTLATESQLKSSEWMINNALWTVEIWSFDTVNYPRLKRNPY
ncbi:MAG TPA: GLUG motif-containing protein [Acholeplasmataceae bacterium]|nr:GLUG motif-containing protein [Acholeplasmataceae bacterium]